MDEVCGCGFEWKALGVGMRVGRWVTRFTDEPLYSRKLHIRVRRARTSCETSLMILALSFGERVVNHLANRCCGIDHFSFLHCLGVKGIPLCPAGRAG